MDLLEWAALGAGIFVVIGTGDSLVRTLVIPRGYQSKLALFIGRKLVWKWFLFLARRFQTYESKDRILALTAPVALLTLFASWLTLFLLGYGLILWAVADLTLPGALRESGASLLTLGFASTPHPGATIVDLLTGATGFMAIALQIAYLPVLYNAFNRRETLVTLLQSRAGSPAWGPEILARHQLVNSVDNLPRFFSEWEVWAADIAESHANYAILVWFRSPHPLRSWILALLAVMDAAALYHALCPDGAPSETRMTLRMGFTCLRDIASALRLPFDPDPFPDDPIQLTFEEFAQTVERLRETGFPMERTPEEAWPHFQGWRVNYEALAYTIADMAVAPPGPWSGERTHLRGVTVTPKRPVDRRPGDPHAEGRLKDRSGS